MENLRLINTNVLDIKYNNEMINKYYDKNKIVVWKNAKILNEIEKKIFNLHMFFTFYFEMILNFNYFHANL